MMPVMTRDGKGIMLDFRQIVFIERRARELIYHTRTDEYRAITSIEKMTEALEPMGFSRLDQSNVVNLSSIKKYDLSRNVVVFDHVQDSKSKEVYVSRENRSSLSQYVHDHRSEISVIYHRNGKK
jgi:DNA-binding LytR/AlgR family response regulator